MSGSVAKRERKKPALYNPADFDGEAGEGKGKRKGKETKDKDKRGKTGDEAFDDLNVEPGSLLQRRISVRFGSGTSVEWYDGVVADYVSASKAEPFLIAYDDGEEERGRIGISTFRTKRDRRAYKWLDLDTERPTSAPGATEHSLQEQDAATLLSNENGTNNENGLAAKLEQVKQPEKRGRGRPKKQAAQASPPQNVDATEQSEDPDKPSSIAEDSATLGRRTPDADTKQNGGETQQATRLPRSSPVQGAETGTAANSAIERKAHDPATQEALQESGGSETLKAAAGDIVVPAHLMPTPIAAVDFKIEPGAPEEQQVAAHGTAKSLREVPGAEMESLQLVGQADLPNDAAPDIKPSIHTGNVKEPQGIAAASGNAVDQADASTSQDAAPQETAAMPTTSLAATAPQLGSAERQVDSSSKRDPEQLQGRPEASITAMKSTTPAAEGDGAEHKKRVPTEKKIPVAPLLEGYVAIQAASNEQSKVDASAKSLEPKEEEVPVAKASPPSKGAVAAVAVLQKRKSPDSKQGAEALQEPPKRLKLDFPSTVKPKRTTSIAAPVSLKILPQNPSIPASQNSPEEPDYNPEPAEPELTPEEVEAEVLCAQLQNQLSGLTRTRDSIGRATATALSGAACQAAARILRMIADAMEGAESARRIDLLYLVDSILQGCMRAGKPGCGPGSKAASSFPKVIAAALPRLIKAVVISVEGIEKLGKVLAIWQQRKLINASVLEHQIGLLQVTRAAKQVTPMSQPQKNLAAPGMQPSSQARGTKGAATVQLMLKDGKESVSAVLEDQYGTHKQSGEGLMLMCRADNSDSDSGDEMDEHEKELRARQEKVQPQGFGRMAMNGGVFARETDVRSGPAWEDSFDRDKRPHGPPGFELDPFGRSDGGLNIQLHKRSSSRNSLQGMYTPQSRLVSRYPSSSVAGHYGPQLASDAWGREDDRLERAGAEDRTFDMEVDPFRPSESGSLDRLDGYTPADMGATPGHPPLPMVDSWNERNPPPLPEEDPPLPFDDGGEQPPLPDELPPMPMEFRHSYPGAAQQQWQDPKMQLQTVQMAPHPSHGMRMSWPQSGGPHP